MAGLDAAGAESRCLKGECEGYITGRLSGDPNRYLLEIALHRAGRREPVIALSAETDEKRIGDALVQLLLGLWRSLEDEHSVASSSAHNGIALGECVTWSGGANALKAELLLSRRHDQVHPESALADMRRALEEPRLGIRVIDVREPNEHEIAHVEGVRLLPLSVLAQRFTELDPNQALYLHCKSGVRSMKALELLVYPPGAVTLSMPIDLPPGNDWVEESVKVSYMSCSDKGCKAPVVGKLVPIRVPGAGMSITGDENE